ncbi:MAG: sialidase family protein, partial [candidate division WOR-3 bacterium]
MTATFWNYATERVKVYELQDIWTGRGQATVSPDEGIKSFNSCVAVNSNRKHMAWAKWVEELDDWCVATSYQNLTNHGGYWTREQTHSNQCDLGELCIATQSYADTEFVYVIYSNWGTELRCLVSRDNGETWSDHLVAGAIEIEDPSIAVDANGNHVYVLFYDDNSENEAVFVRSTDNGSSWSDPVVLGTDIYGHTCIAADRDYGYVFAFWTPEDGRAPLMRWSNNRGVTWYPENGALTVPFDTGCGVSRFVFTEVNAVALSTAGYPSVLVVGRVDGIDQPVASVATVSGQLRPTRQGPKWFWDPYRYWLAPIMSRSFGPVYPSVTEWSGWPSAGYQETLACCVWGDNRRVLTNGIRIFRCLGHWDYDYTRQVAVDNASRHLVLASDGIRHAHGLGPQVVSGPVLGTFLVPLVADAGWSPAIAVDRGDRTWLAYLGLDTLWCQVPEEETRTAVFCGSSSARPGQPSVEVYPDDVSGQYVGAVAFPVYDSVGETSMILWAKFDAEHLLLDTIASVANLRDSCPSINIAYGDSVYVVWQRGDSVVSAKLFDYGPGDWNRPPAWSALELVTAHGRGPMSVLEGDVLHCVWVQRVAGQSTDTFNVCHSTCDLSPTAMFQDWVLGANPSSGATGTTEKANSVYAGCGVTVWQEQVSGVWNIYARVRDS